MHRAVFPLWGAFAYIFYKKKMKIKKKKKAFGSSTPCPPEGLRREKSSPSELKTLPAWADDATTQWPLPTWTDANAFPAANRSKHAIPYSSPSFAVYIYYMHILTTQLIYKKAASKMSKNKNIFFHTPTPSLPYNRVWKEGCTKNHFTFVQEMLHPLRNMHKAGDSAMLLDSWQWVRPRWERSFERMPLNEDRKEEGVVCTRESS